MTVAYLDYDFKWAFRKFSRDNSNLFLAISGWREAIGPKYRLKYAEIRKNYVSFWPDFMKQCTYLFFSDATDGSTTKVDPW